MIIGGAAVQVMQAPDTSAPVRFGLDFYRFGSGGGILDVDVQASGAWVVTSDSGWLTASPASGTGNGTVRLTAAAHTGSGLRLAVVSINGQACIIIQGAGLKAVSAGYNHTLLLRSDNTLLASGANSYGAYGDGTTNTSSRPTEVATNVKAMRAGQTFSLIIKQDDTLWGTGGNTYGQLGQDNTNDVLSPVQIATNVAAVTSGVGHVLYLTTGGALYGIGRNDFGQLGDNSTTNRTTPVSIHTGVTQISAGYYHSLFIKDGAAYAMGANTEGRLGDGSTQTRLTPVQVMTNVARVEAGFRFSLFLKNDGTLWGAGDNSSGQLGSGAATASTPVQIATNVDNMWAGSNFIVFRKTDGSLWGLGGNDYRQLGDATTTNRTTPVALGKSVATAALDRNDLFVPKTGGSRSVVITSTGPYTITHPSWVTVSPTTGTAGDTTVTFTVAATHLPSPRSDWMTLNGQSVQIVQEGDASKAVTLDEYSGNVDGQGGTLTVSIQCPGTWVATSPVNWLQVSPDTGSGNGTLTITATRSTSSVFRTAEIAINGVYYFVNQGPGVFSYNSWLTTTSIPVGKQAYTDTHGPMDMTNLMAYAFGVSPFSATAAHMPVPELGDGVVKLKYRRSKKAMNVTYTVKSSVDLVTWGTQYVFSNMLTGEDSTAEIWEATAVYPDNPKTLFLKVEITAP